jgi:hypothetical protein
MTFALVVFWGITAILGVIALLDWLARRKDSKSEHRSRG